MEDSQFVISRLEARIKELEAELESSKKPQFIKPRSKIEILSSEVTDSNPYSRLVSF